MISDFTRIQNTNWTTLANLPLSRHVSFVLKTGQAVEPALLGALCYTYYLACPAE